MAFAHWRLDRWHSPGGHWPTSGLRYQTSPQTVPDSGQRPSLFVVTTLTHQRVVSNWNGLCGGEMVQRTRILVALLAAVVTSMVVPRGVAATLSGAFTPVASLI